MSTEEDNKLDHTYKREFRRLKRLTSSPYVRQTSVSYKKKKNWFFNFIILF